MPQATWIGRKLAPFGFTGCDDCGTKRLQPPAPRPLRGRQHEPDFEASLAERGLTPEALKDSIV